MLLLLSSLIVAAPEPPTWRLQVRNEATKAVVELNAAHGKKLEFTAGPWRCELVTYTEDPEGDAGRFNLMRYDGFLSCKRPVGTDEAVVLVSAASCSSVEVDAGVSEEVRKFARQLVDRSYGLLKVTLGKTANPQPKGAEQFEVTGGCFRPGLPPPPLAPPAAPPPGTAPPKK